MIPAPTLADVVRCLASGSVVISGLAVEGIPAAIGCTVAASVHAFIHRRSSRALEGCWLHSVSQDVLTIHKSFDILKRIMSGLADFMVDNFGRNSYGPS